LEQTIIVLFIQQVFLCGIFSHFYIYILAAEKKYKKRKADDLRQFLDVV